jgi:hypothetical protein
LGYGIRPAPSAQPRRSPDLSKIGDFMMKAFLAAVAFGAAATMFSAPASAMPIDIGPGAGTAAATKVAWYCNRNGRHCVRAPRRGYALRRNCNWNGRYCGPVVVAPRRPVIVAPRVVAPRVVVRPSGRVVIRP